MWPQRYWPTKFWPARFWPKVGGAIVVIGDTPAERRLIVPAGDRGLTVAPGARRLEVPAADRTLTVT